MQTAQGPADELKLMGPGLMQEALQGAAKTDDKTAGSLAALTGETDKVQTVNPFQSLEKFRFQKLAEKTAETAPVLQEGKEDVSETGPGINMTAQGTGKEKEVIGPGAFKQSGEGTAKTEDGKESLLTRFPPRPSWKYPMIQRKRSQL